MLQPNTKKAGRAPAFFSLLRLCALAAAGCSERGSGGGGLSSPPRLSHTRRRGHEMQLTSTTASPCRALLCAPDAQHAARRVCRRAPTPLALARAPDGVCRRPERAQRGFRSHLPDMTARRGGRSESRARRLLHGVISANVLAVVDKCNKIFIPVCAECTTKLLKFVQ